MAGSSVPGAAIPGLAVPGLAGAGGGGIAVIGTWTASRTIGSGTEIPYPPTMPLACPVSNTGDAGNGLIAFVSWTLPAGYLGADMAVSDDAQPSHGTWSPSFNFNKSPLIISSAMIEVSVLSGLIRITDKAVSICNFSKSTRA